VNDQLPVVGSQLPEKRFWKWRPIAETDS